MSIKETLNQKAYESTEEGMLAYLASEFNIGVNDTSADEIIMSVDDDDRTLAEEVCDGLLSDLQEEYNFDDIVDEVTEWMEETAEKINNVDADKEEYVPVAAVAVAPTAPAAAPAATVAVPAAPVVSAAAPATQPTPTSVPAAVAPAASGKKYSNFILDSFEAGFDKWDDFKSCIRDIEATEEIFTHDEDKLLAGGPGTFDPLQSNLKVEAIDNTPMFAGQIAQRMNADPDAVLSSMTGDKPRAYHEGTGLALVMGNRSIPIGWSAFVGLNKRAELENGGALRHWNKSLEDTVHAYNHQFKNGVGGVTVLVNCGKVRGVMSGRFAYAPYGSILKAFEAFWNQQFPKADVQHMYVSHTSVFWELNLEQYKSQIFNGFNDLLTSNCYPVLQFISSNTANSSFRIVPAIGQTGSSVVVPLCVPSERSNSTKGAVVIEHTASGNFTERCNNIMEKIIGGFGDVISALDASTRDLQAMRGVTINNPYNAILRAMEHEGMPKKQALEAADNFKNVFGAKAVSLYDCFMVTIHAYSFFVRDNPGSQKKQFSVALKVGKIAHANWKENYDLPGTFTW